MEDLCIIITAVLYGVFIIRFILSWVGGDFELDGDVDVSDLVSFKGITHFLMGFFTWITTKLHFTHTLAYWDYVIAILVGILFTIILFLVYKFMMKLESIPIVYEGKDLIGKAAEVYLPLNKDSDLLYEYLIHIDNNNGIVEVKAKSSKQYKTGDSVNIVDYYNNYYFI